MAPIRLLAIRTGSIQITGIDHVTHPRRRRHCHSIKIHVYGSALQRIGGGEVVLILLEQDGNVLTFGEAPPSRERLSWQGSPDSVRDKRDLRTGKPTFTCYLLIAGSESA
ncbi:uncharacterized protein [Pyxicephalus adspersus]|uniref:uncharacterized protein isoform X2 n=1 Tax=Pyxicephalus adspersus TaxID=30357 RepID=UPI003B5C246F